MDVRDVVAFLLVKLQCNMLFLLSLAFGVCDEECCICDLVYGDVLVTGRSDREI